MNIIQPLEAVNQGANLANIPMKLKRALRMHAGLGAGAADGLCLLSVLA
jgi:hypothetical protein